MVKAACQESLIVNVVPVTRTKMINSKNLIGQAFLQQIIKHQETEKAKGEWYGPKRLMHLIKDQLVKRLIANLESNLNQGKGENIIISEKCLWLTFTSVQLTSPFGKRSFDRDIFIPSCKENTNHEFKSVTLFEDRAKGIIYFTVIKPKDELHFPILKVSFGSNEEKSGVKLIDTLVLADMRNKRFQNFVTSPADPE